MTEITVIPAWLNFASLLELLRALIGMLLDNAPLFLYIA
jgi:hypothetical protein